MQFIDRLQNKAFLPMLMQLTLGTPYGVTECAVRFGADMFPLGLQFSGIERNL